MFYSHQILAPKSPFGLIWRAATLNAKINRKNLEKLDIIQICEEILNPSVPMALRLSATLMGGVAIVYKRKVQIVLDDANRLKFEIDRACFKKKDVRDPTLLPKGKTKARKEDITITDNEEEADFDFGGTFPKFGDFQPLHDFFVNPEPQDVGGHQFHQAKPDDITLLEPFQTKNETYYPFERFDIDDELPTPPRGHDIPQGGVKNEIPQQHQDHGGGDVFAEHIVEGGDNRQQPPKKRARKTATLRMDFDEEIVITNVDYKEWLKHTSDIRRRKRKLPGTIRPEMKFLKRMKMPSTLPLFEKYVESSYPAQLHKLWSQFLQTSSPETPGFVQEGKQKHDHQPDPHQDSDLGLPTEKSRKIQTGKGHINHQADDINFEPPFYSGNNVSPMPPCPKEKERSMPSIPSEGGAAVERREGLEAVAKVLFETGSATQEEKTTTENIKKQLKTHFDVPGAPQVESLNKLTSGMNRNAAAKLFYQSCVLATSGAIKVKQTQPYGDIQISRGPNM